MSRWPTRLRSTLFPALALLGMAGAQLDFTNLSLFGRSVPGIQLYGKEYVRADLLTRYWTITRANGVISLEGFGHLLLLPLDEVQSRAATAYNTVQYDTERKQAATATLVNGHLYLPLTTLSSAVGAVYTPGKLSLPPLSLSGVSSRAGQSIDRVVLSLSRDVDFEQSLQSGSLKVVLPGVAGASQTYSTRGVYLPTFRISQAQNHLTFSAALRPGWGYRVYKSFQNGGVRLIVDVGPGVPTDLPGALSGLHKPRIVIDPQVTPSLGGSDAPLELARATAELLSKAGWQVQLTRTAAEAGNLASRLELARQSDLFLSLGLGRFPGASVHGVFLSEPDGPSGSLVIDTIRALDQTSALENAVVSSDGDNKRLADLVSGELKAIRLAPRLTSGRDQLLLQEAPHAALNLEIGWPQNGADRARLADSAQTQSLAAALARGVATYLAARANKAGL